ncbi:MAG: hypothetical protein AAF431_11380 [Pseudomonadota bacterium]
MNLSFKEKGLIASLIVTLLVFGNYFINVFQRLRTDSAGDTGLVGIIIVIVLVIILEATIHGFLSIQAEEEDERDKLIEKVSYRNAYWCLNIGVWFLIVQVFLDSRFMPLAGLTTTPYGLANLLLFSFIVAEVVMFITQLYYYRKGI